jgi:hypothetical protein
MSVGLSEFERALLQRLQGSFWQARIPERSLPSMSGWCRWIRVLWDTQAQPARPCTLQVSTYVYVFTYASWDSSTARDVYRPCIPVIFNSTQRPCQVRPLQVQYHIPILGSEHYRRGGNVTV